MRRTRDEWRAFASEHDCCLEPVLALDEALESDLVAAREMVVELHPARSAAPVKLLGVPVKLSRTRVTPRGPRAGARRAHRRRSCAAAGYSPEELAALHACGASRARPRRSAAPSSRVR